MKIRLTYRRIGDDEVAYPAILRMRDYVAAKRGDRSFASRRDIRPEEFTFALGRIILMDVHQDPLDFVYRLYGSEISEADHDEVTKTSVYDQPAGDYRDHLVACYSEAVAARGATFHEMMVDDGRRQARFQRGLFPLSSDGKTIDILLSVTWWGSELTAIWDDFLTERRQRKA